jgi:hypothetical protein
MMYVSQSDLEMRAILKRLTDRQARLTQQLRTMDDTTPKSVRNAVRQELKDIERDVRALANERMPL